MAFNPRVRRAAFLALLPVVACSPQSNQSRDQNVTGPGVSEAGKSLTTAPQPSVAPVRPATRPSGLSPAEEDGIKSGVMAILLSKRFTPHERLCTEVFDLGQPLITDANLSGSEGRVQVTVPVTGQHPVANPPGWTPQFRFPSRECLGVENEDIWAVGRMIPVNFQFYIEHWQSGWRLSQNQQPR